MLKENFNGTDNLPGRNDVDVIRDLVSSAFSSQKSHGDIKIEKSFENMEHIDIHTSNRRLDIYLFYASSRL